MSMSTKTLDTFEQKMQESAELVGVPSWSEAQMNVFNRVRYGDRNIVVMAVAGSGKTTTLQGIVHALPEGKSSRFLAFNKAIATELEARIPGFPASTIHSYAYKIFAGIYGWPQASSSKIFHIACSHVATSYPNLEWGDANDLVQEIIDPFQMARLTQTDTNSYQEMDAMCFERGVFGHSPARMDDYKVIDEVSRWAALAPKARAPLGTLSSAAQRTVQHLFSAGYQGKSRIPNKPWIDFTEMILFPLESGKIEQENDYVLWDEAQDSNQLYFDFIRETMNDDGIIVAVGDYRQNIMGFAGAFTDGMQSLIRQLDAEVLPLNVSYRLPVSHAQLSTRLFPGTEPAPWAKQGEILECNYSYLLSFIENEVDDPNEVMVICRTNAPAIGFAMRLISHRIPAHVKGRDFGLMLVKIIKSIGTFRKKPRKGLEFNENFLDFVYEWEKKEQQKLQAKDAGERAYEILSDKAASIVALWEGTDAQDIFEFIDDVENLFGEGNGVTLSSIHRSKGLEAKHVAVLEYDRFWLNHRSVTTDSQKFGEDCVRYVALTRAKETLLLATPDDRYGVEE